MPPTCFVSARFARLSESILGTAYLLEDNILGTASFVRLLICLLEPHSSLHINNETLLSEVITTHTDIVSVWWMNYSQLIEPSQSKFVVFWQPKET